MITKSSSLATQRPQHPVQADRHELDQAEDAAATTPARVRLGEITPDMARLDAEIKRSGAGKQREDWADHDSTSTIHRHRTQEGPRRDSRAGTVRLSQDFADPLRESPRVRHAPISSILYSLPHSCQWRPVPRRK